MILVTDLDSIIESLYLDIPLTNKFREATIIVNPENITYLTGKTVIINRFNYPLLENLDTLLSNNNEVVVRYSISSPQVKYIPYFPRLCSKILWNGQYVRFLNEDISEGCDYLFDGDNLYFPKCKEYLGVVNLNGDTNSLGWLLYQLGENLYKTPFTDLDIVKIGKGIFPS